jgi:hypothetical protein
VTPSVRRATAERLLFSILSSIAALMAAAYLVDLIGLAIRGVALTGV